MSDAHSHGDAHGHADAHHDDFDPEPATGLSEGEPRTPAWLPVLGAGLFLIGAVWFLAGDGPEAPPVPAATTTAAPAAKAPAAGTGAAQIQPAGGAAGQAKPTPIQDPAARQQVIDLMNKRKAEAGLKPTQLNAGKKP